MPTRAASFEIKCSACLDAQGKPIGPLPARARVGRIWSRSDIRLERSEDRMSTIVARYRILGVLVFFFLGTLLVGCSGYSEDPGANRSQQQSEQLQNRIKTTQVDR